MWKDLPKMRRSHQQWNGGGNKTCTGNLEDYNKVMGNIFPQIHAEDATRGK